METTTWYLDVSARVFQQFAELDLLSGGRAEIMAGRGSFIESFPLFGVAQMSVGAVAQKDVLRSMELFGTEVAPLIRTRCGGAVRPAAPPPTPRRTGR